MSEVITTIERESSSHSSPILGRIYIEANGMKSKMGWFRIHPNFTSNCQLACVEYLSVIISNSTSILLAMKFIKEKGGKPLVLGDIPTRQVPILEKAIGSNAFKMKTNYISTNKSEMTIVIIELSQVIDATKGTKGTVLEEPSNPTTDNRATLGSGITTDTTVFFDGSGN